MSADEKNTYVVLATPISLRNSDHGWEISCGGSPPLLLPTTANPELVETVRRALDHRKQLHFTIVTGSQGTISSITERLGNELPSDVIKSAPVLPPSVTPQLVKDRIPKTEDAYGRDRVLWVTPIPASRVIRVTFEKLAAPYYLAEAHPRKAVILKVAQQSIQSGTNVRVAISGQFILDLLPAQVKGK